MIYGMLWLMLTLMLIDLVLRGFALYFSAREEKHPYWFIALLMLNTLGLLPLIYLIIRDSRKTPIEFMDEPPAPTRMVKKRRADGVVQRYYVARRK